jgi:hypothetical protein
MALNGSHCVIISVFISATAESSSSSSNHSSKRRASEHQRHAPPILKATNVISIVQAHGSQQSRWFVRFGAWAGLGSYAGT